MQVSCNSLTPFSTTDNSFRRISLNLTCLHNVLQLESGNFATPCSRSFRRYQLYVIPIKLLTVYITKNILLELKYWNKKRINTIILRAAVIGVIHLSGYIIHEGKRFHLRACIQQNQGRNRRCLARLTIFRRIYLTSC